MGPWVEDFQNYKPISASQKPSFLAWWPLLTGAHINLIKSCLWRGGIIIHKLILTGQECTLAHARLASKNDTATGSFCARLLGELDCRGEETPNPRTGAAYIDLGEACLTPGLVVHGLCLPPHLHAYIWLVNLSLIWLVNLFLIWLVNFSLIWLVNFS